MLALTAFLLAGLPAADSTPVRPIHQWAHKAWSEADGAPSGIHVLAQTRDGYLWLGTVFGLVRFDGVRFAPFVPQLPDSVPALGVRDLLGSRDGSLWIVWETGTVSHLREGRLTNFDRQDGLPPVYQLAESTGGELVAGTESGLARLKDGSWQKAPAEWGFHGSEGRAVWFDSKDALWVETAHRVIYRPSGGAFLDPDQPLLQAPWQADFTEAPDGTIWMAELANSAHTLRRVGERTPRTEVRVGAFSLLIDRKGSLWVGSRGDGLRRLPEPSRFLGRSIKQFGTEAEQYTERDGLLSNIIWDMLLDHEGSIWVASDRGLERFREGSLVPYTTRGGLRPRAVFAARDSSVWISAYSVQEITRIGPRGRDEVHEPPCWCYRMAQDSLGGIWAFSDTFLVRFEGLHPTRLHLTGGTFLGLDALTIDNGGTVWVSDRAMGLVQVIGNRMVPIVPAKELGRATALIADRKGRIWAGSGDRVLRWDHGTLTAFDPDEGGRHGQITNLYEDHAGGIWAAGSSGLHRFEDGRFRNLSRHQALPGGAVFAVQEDDTGAWWLVTRSGLLRLEAGELERAFADTSYRLRYRTFDREDGLPGAIRVTKLPVLTRTRDGRIWVAADEGVAVIDPRHLERAQSPLRVIVEAVRFAGREARPVDGRAVAPGSGDLEVDYTTTTLSIAERVQFRYRLEGADTAWREVGTRRRAYYTGLGPGSYRFLVSASQGDGNWEQGAASWSFRVLPAWYQTLWFRALAVLLIGGIGGVAVALIQRRRHLRVQAELRHNYEITLAERARIAEDLHDTLLQGFTGVTLQLVKAEGALPDEPVIAAETINRVQRLAQESLREARERVWELRESIAASDDLAAALEAIATERSNGLGIDVTVTTAGSPRRLAGPVGDAAFRIGREAIVNAVLHAGARRIEVHLDFGVVALCLEVRDDGRGFDLAEADGASRRGHFGIRGMRDRATHLGGRCDLRTRPGGGTVVALELPLAPVTV